MAEKTKIFINEVSFTKREIDVISCITNGKSAKSAATLLKISPNTVNVHMRNITNKVGSSSKDNIIKFIEKSDQYTTIHEHYLRHICGKSQDLKRETDNNHQVTSNKGIIFTIIMLALGILYLLTIHRKHYIRPNVPLITNDIFVDREDIIKKIENSFQGNKGNRVVILVGPGGSGKTTIARRYLLSRKEEVIWEINAENENLIKLSFDNLANLLSRTKKQKEDLNFIKSITNGNEKYTKLIFFVADILKNTKKWIILFENVSDFQAIKNYFPHDPRVWGIGKVIVTSRNANIKNTAFFNKRNIIDMGVLTQEKKEQLFMNIIGESYRTDNEKKSLRNFLDHIISLPLDVASAAYYIKSSGISHDDYLKKIKIRDKTFDNSQSKLLEENLNYKKTRYGIITSILDDIIGRHREFKKIWLMICLLASNDIPKSYLKTIECSTMVDAFIHNLLEHFLITDNGDTFGVHHITQEIGLQYIEEKLSDDEKIKYLDNIVEHMTQYKKNDYVKTSMHLQSMMHQISCLNLNESKKKQYDIRLRLAFLHCCEHSKSPDLSKNTQRK